MKTPWQRDGSQEVMQQQRVTLQESKSSLRLVRFLPFVLHAAILRLLDVLIRKTLEKTARLRNRHEDQNRGRKRERTEDRKRMSASERERERKR